MNDQNTDAAKKAAELNEERMRPIFDECEVNDYGEVKRHHMLSMNGMYISGITDEQLKEMHGKLTELLTGEKPRKYYYAETSIPLKTGDILCKKDFVVETDGDKFPLADALLRANTFFENSEYKEDLDFKNAHICCCIEISKEDYEAFQKYRKK
jgi:hypothetical protein|nr:MAG TPA_asm: hypothetical protein [Caudoviricetes sp.]